MADPKEFFQHYMVTIAGYSNRAAGPTRFRMFLNPGTKTGPAKFMLQKCANPDPGDGTCAHDELIAFYVPMLDAGAAYSQASLPATGGPDFMVTSQLTGCSFGHFAGAGGTMVTHLQPGQGRSFPDNDALIRKNMGAGAHIMSQSAGYNFLEDAVTVVGKRVSGIWSFYAQNQRKQRCSVDARELVKPITAF